MRLLPAALLLALAACGRGERAKEERRQVVEGLTLSQSDGGRPSWTLKSRLAVLREEEKRATLAQPVMEFYEDGRAVSRVTALTGEIDTLTHDVKLSSSVAMDSFEERSHLTTSELDYDPRKGRFTTTAEILVERPEGVLRGKGLEAKPDLSEIRIFNQNSTLNARPK